MAWYDSMVKGGKKMMSNPGAALKRMKGNAAGQTNKMGKGMDKAGHDAGMALTRGSGLKPARDLGKLMKEVHSKVAK